MDANLSGGALYFQIYYHLYQYTHMVYTHATFIDNEMIVYTVIFDHKPIFLELPNSKKCKAFDRKDI